MRTGYRQSVLALLRQPRWLGLAAVTVVMCVLFWWLGTWQWGRHLDRSARNDAVESTVNVEPVPLTTLMPDPSTLDEARVYRSATATGKYLAAGQVLQRNPLGRSGFDVVTPLALSSGGTLLVNRGWIASSSTDTSSPAADVTPPSGLVAVVVRLRAPQPSSGRLAPPGQIYDIEPQDQLADVGAPAYAAYGELIKQDPAPDPALELAGPIETGLGVHLFYAVQWWLFIVIAIGGYFALLRRESQETESPRSMSGSDTQSRAGRVDASPAEPLN